MGVIISFTDRGDLALAPLKPIRTLTTNRAMCPFRVVSQCNSALASRWWLLQQMRPINPSSSHRYLTTTPLSFALKSASTSRIAQPESITVRQKCYPTDDWTNITPRIIELTERNLLFESGSPLKLLRKRIEDYFYNNFTKKLGQGRSPAFSVHTNLSPVVSLWENFDSLLTPADHVSR